MSDETQTLYDAWLADKPECVKELAKKFNPSSIFDIGGEIYYLIGFAEPDEGDPEGAGLIISKFNPATDYDSAMANKYYICAKHFENCECERRH
jgi:hypothetical protein